MDPEIGEKGLIGQMGIGAEIAIDGARRA